MSQPQPPSSFMKSSANALDVLYLDNHLLAVNKPAGLLTQPTTSDAPDLETQAKAFLKQKFKKEGNVFLHPIHRLDKPVSGIVLFARSSKALSRLNAQMRQKTIQKTYFAKVEGHLKSSSGTLKHTLSHASHRAQVSPSGKEALLSYTVLKTYPHSTLVTITLHTGRYHQIRAQFAHSGHPIVGDAKYGSTQKSPSIALHHGIFTFEHPISKESITLKSKCPFA